MRKISMYTYLSQEGVNRLFCGKRFSLSFRTLTVHADSVIIFNENGHNSYIKNRHHYTRDIQEAPEWECICGKVYVLISHVSQLFKTIQLRNLLYMSEFQNNIFETLHMVEIDLDLVDPKLRWEYIYALTELCNME